MNHLIPQHQITGTTSLPAPIEAGGSNTKKRFLEFFTAHIENPNTRRAYARAAADFFIWLEQVSSINDLRQLEPIHISAWPVSEACLTG